MLSRDPRRALANARRCNRAYLAPSWRRANAQILIEIVGGIQYVAVAGTNDPRDVLCDIALLPFVSRVQLGTIRKGFADAWEPVRDHLVSSNLLDPLYPTFLTCHSLGVPIAEGMIPVLQDLGFDVLGCEGFGAPAAWGMAGKKAIESRRVPILEWKNHSDPVAGNPDALGWSVGDRAQITDGKIYPVWTSPVACLRDPITATKYHLLEGDLGYIHQLEGL